MRWVFVLLLGCGASVDNENCAALGTCPATCGDSVVDDGEACDDGNAIEGDGCDSNCTESACGNGISASGETCFGPTETVASGMLPRAIRLADLDGDGDFDAVIANNTSGTVVVFLNDGAGAFTASSPVASGGGTNCIALEDFDRDGKIDVAAVNITDSSIAVMRNTGGGMLAAPVVIPLAMAAGPISLAAGDIDGDGDVDLVTANFTASTLSVLRNTNGVFGAPVDLVSPVNPHAISIRDLDGNGSPELVVAAHGADAIAVFANTAGSFAAATTFPVGDGPEDSIAIGDLDGDGRLDLISTNTFTADLSILRGTGNNSFAAQRVIALPAMSFPQSITAGDVDEDGDLDLVVAIKELDSVGVLRNDGSGGFAEPLLLPVGDNPESVVVGDVNGDGRLDVLTANAGSGDLVVLLSAP